MLMLESLRKRNNLKNDYKLCSLSDMISESYRVLYSCKRGTKLYKLAEAHIEDVRNNPTELKKLSENLYTLKQAVKSRGISIREDELAKTSPDQKISDEVGDDKVTEEDGVDVIKEADKRFTTKKGILPEMDEVDLKEKRTARRGSARRVSECTASYTKHRKGLKNFRESSNGKAFYRTFKKMSPRLGESRKPLTLAESITLYKAANSAMTQMAIELEHNPSFIRTFRECTNLLERDTRNLLSCIKSKKTPTRGIVESLRSFSNVLLEEDEDTDYEDDYDEEDISDTDIGDEDEELDDEDEDEVPEVAPEDIPDIIDDQIPEEDIEDIEDQNIQDAVDDVTDEEAEELLKYLYVMRQVDSEDEEGASDEDNVVPDDYDVGDVTDEELGELADHLKETRKIKKMRETIRARRAKKMSESSRRIKKTNKRVKESRRVSRPTTARRRTVRRGER